MKLTRQEEEWTRLALIRAIIDTQITLVRIQRDLEVLGSEFSPYLHQADRQLDQLRQEIQHHALNRQGHKDGDPTQDDESPSGEA